MTTLHTLDVAPYYVSWHGASWRDIEPPITQPVRRTGENTVRKGTYLERVRAVVGAQWLSQAEILDAAGGRKDSTATAIYMLHRQGELEREAITLRGRARFRYRKAQALA